MEPKAHPEWKELFERFKSSPYGDLISHIEIESIVGLSRAGKESKYYAVVNRWKKAMLDEASRQIECENSVGYRLVKPEEFRNSAGKQIKFGHRRMRKAGKIVKNVPMDLLSDEEKRKVGETSTILAQILHFTKATSRRLKEVEKKTDQLLLDVGKALDVGD